MEKNKPKNNQKLQFNSSDTALPQDGDIPNPDSFLMLVELRRQQANQIPLLPLESGGQGVPLMQPGDDGRSLTEAFPIPAGPKLPVPIAEAPPPSSDSNQSTSRMKHI